MELGRWMALHGMSQRALGDRLEPPVSQGLVWQWLNGKSRMSLEQALFIQDVVTHGAVTVRELALLSTRYREPMLDGQESGIDVRGIAQHEIAHSAVPVLTEQAGQGLFELCEESA